MSSYYPNPFQPSTGGTHLSPSRGSGQNTPPPPNNGKNIQSSPQQRQRRTCGRCRIHDLPCNGGKPCNWCIQAGEGERCAFGPSPNFPPAQLPAAAPAPVTSPGRGNNPNTPPRRPQQGSTSSVSPRQAPGSGSGSGSPCPPRPRGEFLPGVLIGDDRPLAPRAATPAPASPPALSPEERARQERARILNAPPSREAGGPAYGPVAPSGTDYTGDEEELARIERENQVDDPFFMEAWEAMERSRAAEVAEKERDGEMKKNWERMTKRDQ